MNHPVTDLCNQCFECQKEIFTAGMIYAARIARDHWNDSTADSIERHANDLTVYNVQSIIEVGK